MLKISHKNQYFLFNFDKKLEDQRLFFDPVFWQQQDRIVGSAKGRGTTWFIRSKDLFGVNVALRHYYRGGLFGKIIKDQYPFWGLNKTRSFAEFLLLKKMYDSGLPVPQPIAARVVKSGLYYRADLLSERIENAQDLTTLLQKSPLAPPHWQAIGRLIRQLHDLQICHTDLNAHNILWQAESQQPWLIDFDKCFEKQGAGWKKGNLQRLYRSFQKEIKRMGILFSEGNWANLLKGYEQTQK